MRAAVNAREITRLAEADFAVVLATPDDQGHRAGRPDETAFRARQNVVLEMGMLLTRLGRRKVAILLKKSTLFLYRRVQENSVQRKVFPAHV